MDKYQPLRDARTNGANYGLGTDDIIAHLREWDAKYGISISNVKHDAVEVTFDKVPDDASSLAADIYGFCPDTVDQNFGCIAEMIDMADEMGQEVPLEIEELTRGVDLEDENYGLELLGRSLEKGKLVALWWD